ncbi:STAS domain-containing protein [Streptomyces sp. NPDC046876]|uniref:STAS domain-containing protein n=1 Tax=Streptomyces sp. NPDC046876 TaxID=3155616 RepID=UPI0033E6D30F
MNPFTTAVRHASASPSVSAPRRVEDLADPGLGITVTSSVGGVMVVAVSGEIDLHSAVHLRRALAAALAGCQDQFEIALDLSAVTFCDCSGLNALLRARRRARRECVSLTISAAAPPVSRLLELTGTAALFDGRAATVSGAAAGA